MAKQNTLAGPFGFDGVGAHSGRHVCVDVLPAAEDSGIVFVRRDLEGAPEVPALIGNVRPDALTRQTTLASPDRPEAVVATVEHLMASLHGLAVDNCRVEVDGPEIPLLDGSAEPIAEALTEAGVEEQSAERRPVVLDRPVEFAEGGVELTAYPSETLRLTFFLDYSGTMIGRQQLSMAVTPETFASELAPARTFCLRQEVDYLREKGLIRGGSLDMALVVDGDSLVNEGTDLRYDDEFVRHKMLDLLGDLYLLGRPLRAHVTAVRSGHASHARFVARIAAAAEPALAEAAKGTQV